ncbi:hypothetical protein TNCV_3178301 [Trichonephila clavipes]|nr:hypothetical protein TNCV_3178301 [Trichonephila clavipes]
MSESNASWVIDSGYAPRSVPRVVIPHNDTMGSISKNGIRFLAEDPGGLYKEQIVVSLDWLSINIVVDSTVLLVIWMLWLRREKISCSATTSGSLSAIYAVSSSILFWTPTNHFENVSPALDVRIILEGQVGGVGYFYGMVC